MFGHPLSARKMTLVCVPRAVRLTLWVDVQHYSSDFPPVRALAVGL
ncbi:hypothetical protein JQ569_36740 [Bradyrhizobium elkanii]|nr:hypothetical protein [Bradyrhizobium elkanii]